MDSQQTFLSPELSHRLAAVDIGTNSMRLIIAEALREGKYRIVDDEKEATRLGRNLAATGALDPTAIADSLAALRRMKQIIDGYQVNQVRAIATCAVREAENGAEFVDRVKQEIGLDIDVITAEEEALLAFFGVRRAFELEGKNVAVVDIGGGSTEIVLASGDLVDEIYTTPLGAVRMTELYDASPALSNKRFERLKGGIDRLLRRHTSKPPFEPHLLIGSGGTFTTLAAILMAERGQGDLPVQGHAVTRAEVAHLCDRLRKMSPKARRSVPGLGPDRADIIVAGIAIIDAVMRRLNVNRLQVHAGGVRDGLLLTMVDDSFGRAGVSSGASDAVSSFAARCGVDVPHCRHVSALAASLFDQLADTLQLDPSDRRLLEAAAVLQDVGYLINYDQHHKHSYHLIVNSRLPEFEPHELELVANIARYHRGSKPKRKHENFSRLTSADRTRVRKLAALLRLAGGLDRSHSQQVESVCAVCNDETITLSVDAAERPEADIFGTRRRAALFEDVFDRELKVRWSGADAEETSADDASIIGASPDTASPDEANPENGSHGATPSNSPASAAATDTATPAAK
ncbi:MAG: Ppx/GppA family phosphatase [Planctomycetales bacterium]|nr:Ppx/GppA family phosphatase [Planctomycetales bacterium]